MNNDKVVKVNSIVLAKNGDCCVSVVNDIYKVLVRIDDPNLQIMFAHKIRTVLEYIDEQLQETGEAIVTKIPKDVYRHIPLICEEDYGMSPDEVESVKSFLEEGYTALSKATGTQPEADEMIINVVTMSCFLDFRKNVLGLEEFPNIYFAFPESEEQKKGLIKNAATLREVLKKDIGQA